MTYVHVYRSLKYKINHTHNYHIQLIFQIFRRKLYLDYFFKIHFVFETEASILSEISFTYDYFPWQWQWFYSHKLTWVQCWDNITIYIYCIHVHACVRVKKKEKTKMKFLWYSPITITEKSMRNQSRFKYNASIVINHNMLSHTNTWTRISCNLLLGVNVKFISMWK